VRRATFTLAALGALTCATTASAENNGAISPGAVVSAYYSPATSWELGAGVDVSYMYYRGSFFRGDLGVGGYAQVQGVFDLRHDYATRTRFVVGGQAAKYAVLGGMTGLVFETGDSRVPSSFGVETAPYFSMGIMTMWASVTFPISDLFVPRARGFQFGAHLAGKLPITVHGSSVYKDITLASGRPLRARDGRARVAKVRRTSRDLPARLGEELSADDRRLLAVTWARDAAMEHASIAAFARVALELMALGAPLPLIDAAHRAARDEIAHADVCFALASAYAGASLESGPLPAAGDAPRPPDVVSLAVETYVDGCVGESGAAAAARFGARTAKVPAVARALRRIAREEATHARLAWAIVEWCSANDERVLPAVLRVARELAPPRASTPSAHPLAAHGYVSDRVRGALLAREAERAYARLLRSTSEWSSSSTVAERSRLSPRTTSPMS